MGLFQTEKAQKKNKYILLNTSQKTLQQRQPISQWDNLIMQYKGKGLDF